ncbi:hypothetical protein N9A21_02895 [Methylophilaceae bacterium]|nr:hypothetical protein [Methylophilaceae bacterium]
MNNLLIILMLIIPNSLFAQKLCNYDYLKKEFPPLYKKIVEKTNSIPKIFTFCSGENHYLFNVTMFQQFNNGVGINRALEKDLFSYLLEEYDANSYSRTSLVAGKDQQLQLVSNFTNKKPFEAIELRQEVFVETAEPQVISYGKTVTYIRRNNSEFAQYFKPTELSEEDRIYLEKFKRFVGLQKLN